MFSKICKFYNRRNLFKIYQRSNSNTNPISNFVEIFINNQSIKVPPGTTIMQAAIMLGIEIPRFCYHDKLSIAGNCRMCLVEVEKMPKPVASCAMPVMNGWRIHTDSEFAKKARESVMEFLLINHPLDCPICDQGGECDLQDQSMSSGTDRSRFIESNYAGKRAVEDKYIGPLVKTIMNRCIHCTRCVRFMAEIAGVEQLGTTGRGSDMQIGTYLEHALESELSGNIIDVCPVGALTSLPDQFSVRPWEMKKFESIDISDAVGSNIIVGVRTSDVMRILPQPNEEINEDWISDKTRFMYDGLKYQRLMSPMILENYDYKTITWKDAFIKIARVMLSAKPYQCYGIAGQLNDAESLVSLRDLFHKIDSENLFTEDQDHVNLETQNDFRCTYKMNNSIQNIEAADVVILVGVCTRYESPLIDAKIRKSFIHNNLKVIVFGEEIPLTYPYDLAGSDSDSFLKFIQGNHEKSIILENSRNPMILIGNNVSTTSVAGQIHQACVKFSIDFQKKHGCDWNPFNIVHRHAGYVNCLDIGYKPWAGSFHDAKLIYLLGTDGGKINKADIPENCLVVYQGHHGDIGAQLADIILPGCAYTEKSGIYTNTEGRAQLANRCVTSPGDSREDWKILRALSEVIGKPLEYDDIITVRKRLSHISPHFSHVGSIQPSGFLDLVNSINVVDNKCANVPIRSRITKLSDFYLTDSISRNSRTLAKCVEAAHQRLLPLE